MITSSDVFFIFSGGSVNADPAQSLGGDPSVYTVTSNLFDDVSKTEAAAGLIDYRCFYIANNSEDSSLYYTKVYVKDDVVGGSTVQLGFLFQNDFQNLTIINGTLISGGTYTIKYEETELEIPFASPISNWGISLQDTLRTVPGLEEITVTTSNSGTSVLFEIEFGGTAGNRFHPELEIISYSDLTPSSTASVVSSKIIDGSPLNSIAPEIDTDVTTPSGMVFSYPTITNPLNIGELKSGDVLPVWIKRTTLPLTTALENDGMAVAVDGEPFA